MVTGIPKGDSKIIKLFSSDKKILYTVHTHRSRNPYNVTIIFSCDERYDRLLPIYKQYNPDPPSPAEQLGNVYDFAYLYTSIIQNENKHRIRRCPG